METIDIYTDASIKIEDKVAKHFIGYAGVILDWDGNETHMNGVMFNKTIRDYFKMPRREKITTTHAEMIAILKSLWALRKTDKHLLIYTDSINAINHFLKNTKVWSKPQYKGMVDQFDKIVSRIKKNGGKVTLHWVKGHAGCVGNNIADKLSKIDIDLHQYLTKNQLKKLQNSSDGDVWGWLCANETYRDTSMYSFEKNDLKNYQHSYEHSKTILNLITITQYIRYYAKKSIR